jgi:gliding motility-associated-like protein
MTIVPGYVLEAGEGMASYLWNTGSTDDHITINLEGWYWVEMISQAGCYGLDSVYIKVPYECIFIPNAFTPNGDGLNDTFRAYSRCPITYYRMLIYNRWGELLFESHDIEEGWDGRKNGKMCQGDAYVYLITFKAEEALGAEQQQTKYGIFISVK